MDGSQEFLGVEKKLLLSGMQKKIPINGTLELTTACNLSCRMCYVHSSAETPLMLPLSDWFRIAEEMKEAGTLFLMLSGGEPLLYPSFRELYSKLKEMGFILTVNTNGTLLNQEWADFFSENKPRRINISLYGATEKEYGALCAYTPGFEKAFEAIRLLREKNVSVKVNFSAMPENFESFEKILSMCREWGVPVFADSYMFPAPGCEQRSDRLSPGEAAEIEYRSLKERFGEDWVPDEKEIPDEGTACMAGKCSFGIDAQGNLRPCALMNEPSVSLKAASFRVAFDRLVTSLQKPLFPDACRSCQNLSWCRVCPEACLRETGNHSTAPKRLCVQAKALKSCFSEKTVFRIGDFLFDAALPEDLPVPGHFMQFSVEPQETAYHYRIVIEDDLFVPEREPDFKNEDCHVYLRGTREARLLYLHGDTAPYAFCEETGPGTSCITINREKLPRFMLDTVFSSTLSLEKRLFRENSFVFHCTFMSFQDEAILFTGPSGAGKSTQGNLWEKAKGAKVINGDRALLSLPSGDLTAQGFPVCGSSEICLMEQLKVRSIIYICQAQKNRVEPVRPAEAFSLLYPQLTVNRKNREFVKAASDFLEHIVAETPVFRLFCTISEEAVNVLHEALYGEGFRSPDD